MITRRHFCALTAAGAVLLPVEAGAEAKIVRIPIKPTAFGTPTMQVTIAGQGPFTFAIDTGAGIAIIAPAIAKSLGLISNRDIRISSLKGTNISRVYTVQEMIMGGAIRVPEFEMAAIDEYHLDGIDGVLPVNFLNLLPSQLDFEASELRYYLGGARMDLDGFHEINSFFHADNPKDMEKVYVEVMAGGEKLLCCLDTGASSAVLVNSDFVEKHKWWDRFPLLRETSGVGANGAALKTRIVAAGDVTIGGLPLESVAMTLSDPHERQAKGMTYDGLVGTPFIRRFTVAFAPGRYLYFKPNDVAVASPESSTPVAGAVNP